MCSQPDRLWLWEHWLQFCWACRLAGQCFSLFKGRQHCQGPTTEKVILLSTTGDHFYKRNKNLPPEEQMISALPDIKVLTINDDHDFMVIACDGIW